MTSHRRRYDVVMTLCLLGGDSELLKLFRTCIHKYNGGHLESSQITYPQSKPSLMGDIWWRWKIKFSNTVLFRYPRWPSANVSNVISCADPESFVRGVQIWHVFFFVLFFCCFFFSLMRRGRIQIPLLAGHQWPTSETSFLRWKCVFI